MRLLRMKLSRWKVGEAYFLLYCLLFMASIVFSDASPPNDDLMCPPVCTCNQPNGTVDCSGNGLKDVPEEMPPWTRYLFLSNNRLSSHGLTKYNFRKLGNLEELDLGGNKLPSLTLDLTGLRHLHKICLDHCSLTTLPTIQTSSNVTHLHLSHNSVSVIGDNLKNFSTLTFLDLSFNKLKQIPPDTFINQDRLVEINLQKNRIASLSWDSFAGLNSIEILDLSRNKMKNIKSSSPQPANKQEICSGHLQTLKHLDLSQNQLTHVDGLTFSGMCSLESLRMDRNKIARLSDGAFYGPTALKTLILEHNFISAITKGWLFQLFSLQTLSVSFNNLSRIEGDAWNFCKELLNLDLSHNRLTSLSSHGFSELAKLRILQLSDNRISFLEDFAFDGLGQLRTLNVSNNEISSSVEDIDGAFLGLNSIEYLSLQNNRIRSLSSSALKGVENVVTLDLRGNDVTSIQNLTFEKMTNLKTLSIVSSSFLCDCQLAWFPRWLRLMDKLRYDFSYSVEGSCFHPPKLEGKDILGIDDEEFVCVDHPIPIMLQEPAERTALIGDNITFECSASATYTNVANGTGEESVEKPLSGSLTSTATGVGIPQAQNHQFLLGDVLEPLLEGTGDLPIELEDSPPKPGETRNSRSGGFPLKADEPRKEPEQKRTPLRRRDTNKRLGMDKSGMAVTWKRGQEIIHSGPGIEIRNITRQQGGYVYVTSLLVLKGVTSNDDGKYNCIVSNSYGHTRSKPVELVVNEYPRFTKTPANVTTVMNGSSAVIDCAAIGQPSPLIQWQKDGGKDFPAAKQRRLRREQSNVPKTLPADSDSSASDGESGLAHKSEGGMMLIPGESGKKGAVQKKNEKFAVDSDAPLDFAVVFPEDAGEYECVVESVVGKIVAKAMLIVEMPPFFLNPLEPETKSFSGENAVIGCFADGKPTPEITWRFDGEALNLTSRHHLAEKSQMLVVTDLKKTDTGVYSCLVRNKHGRIQHSTQLVLRDNSDSDILIVLSSGLNPLWLALFLLVVIIFVFLFTWFCCHIQYKKRHKKARSTNTDETDLERAAPLDANSFTSTDESLRKGQSSPTINHMTDDRVMQALKSNGRYDPSPYRGSASMSDISRMQILQTPGGQSTAPLLSSKGFLPRHAPKRSLSSVTVEFRSADNFRIEERHALETRKTARQKNLSARPVLTQNQPLMSPSALYAKKAAGEDNYVPVVLKAQKSCDSVAPSGTTRSQISKNGNSLGPACGRVQSQKSTQSKEGKSRAQGRLCKKVQNNAKPAAVSNGKVPLCPSSTSEQNNTGFYSKKGGKTDNFAKTCNNQSALRSRPRRDRQKTALDFYHMDRFPPRGSTDSKRLLCSDDTQSKPKVSNASSETADFSSATTSASESSSLLSHHDNMTPVHNYHAPLSGCISDRSLS